MRKKVEGILVDIDGCVVVTHSDGIFREYYDGLCLLSEQIKKANNGDFPLICFCTGRDRNYVEAISFVVGVPNNWSIIESGIALFNTSTKEMILNPGLTPEIKKAFEEISKERIPKIIEKYPGLFSYPGNLINVAIELRYGFETPIEECYERVKEELSDLEGLINIRHSTIAVDISPHGIDKASGVEFWTQKTGISREKILGIGDSNGDFPLFNSVDFVGCPLNASDECKKLVRAKGGYVSPFPHAAGVADIIHHFKPWM